MADGRNWAYCSGLGSKAVFPNPAHKVVYLCSKRWVIFFQVAYVTLVTAQNGSAFQYQLEYVTAKLVSHCAIYQMKSSMLINLCRNIHEHGDQSIQQACLCEPQSHVPYERVACILSKNSIEHLFTLGISSHNYVNMFYPLLLVNFEAIHIEHIRQNMMSCYGYSLRTLHAHAKGEIIN